LKSYIAMEWILDITSH